MLCVKRHWKALNTETDHSLREDFYMMTRFFWLALVLAVCTPEQDVSAEEESTLPGTPPPRTTPRRVTLA